jgi:ketosteroid isomerase-like protein
MEFLMTPAEIVASLIDLMSQQKVQEALELYHDEVDLRVEFGLPHPHAVKGKARLQSLVTAIKEQRQGKPARMYQDISVEDLVIHQTTNPNIVIAEWTYRSRIDGATVENPNIIVVECRDGKVYRSRDYHNHVTRAVADGTLAALIEAIRGMALPQDAQ